MRGTLVEMRTAVIEATWCLTSIECGSRSGPVSVKPRGSHCKVRCSCAFKVLVRLWTRRMGLIHHVYRQMEVKGFEQVLGGC